MSGGQLFVLLEQTESLFGAAFLNFQSAVVCLLRLCVCRSVFRHHCTRALNTASLRNKMLSFFFMRNAFAVTVCTTLCYQNISCAIVVVRIHRNKILEIIWADAFILYRTFAFFPTNLSHYFPQHSSYCDQKRRLHRSYFRSATNRDRNTWTSSYLQVIIS